MSAATTISTAMTTTERLETAVTGLEPDSAMAIRAAFETMFSQADEWVARARSITVTSIDQKREMKLARESRLALKEIRVKAEHARKRLKEDSTRRGKAIDGIANVLKALIEPIEEHLLEQETFAERAEEARVDALREARSEALRAYGADPSVYANLGATSDETWAQTLESARMAHEARLEAARQAEAVRVEAERLAAERRETARQEAVRAEAERVERERAQAEENARLKAERIAADQAAAAERKAAAEEKAKAEAKARAEREAAEAETRKAREAAEKAAAELAAEREAAAKAEAARVAAQVEEQRKAAEVEAARVAAEEEARQAAELAPDREKLAAFAATLRTLTIPTMATARGKAAGAKVADQIAKMVAWVEKTGATL